MNNDFILPGGEKKKTAQAIITVSIGQSGGAVSARRMLDGKIVGTLYRHQSANPSGSLGAISVSLSGNTCTVKAKSTCRLATSKGWAKRTSGQTIVSWNLYTNDIAYIIKEGDDE